MQTSSRWGLRSRAGYKHRRTPRAALARLRGLGGGVAPQLRRRAVREGGRVLLGVGEDGEVGVQGAALRGVGERQGCWGGRESAGWEGVTGRAVDQVRGAGWRQGVRLSACAAAPAPPRRRSASARSTPRTCSKKKHYNKASDHAGWQSWSAGLRRRARALAMQRRCAMACICTRGVAAHQKKGECGAARSSYVTFLATRPAHTCA